MRRLSTSGGFALGLIGAVAVVAAIGLGITFLTGNLHVDFGSETEAQTIPTNECLDDVLGDLDGVPGFTIDDLLAYRDAFEAQDPVWPESDLFDRDRDGDIDIDDVLVYVQELRECLDFVILP